VQRNDFRAVNALTAVSRAIGRLRWRRQVALCRRIRSVGGVSLGSRGAVTVANSGAIFAGDAVVIGSDAHIFVSGHLSIGNHVFINRWSYISALENVTIGNNVLIGERVSIHDENHSGGLPRMYETKPVTIGNDVWIGANVTLLAGAEVGQGSIIAAGAVVRTSVPAGVLAAGVPARVVKRLF
jgi:acetyltransferase-like isoleucine patch superfamily enzyme